MTIFTTVAGTGHRPKKLGGYGKPVLRKLVDLAGWWLDRHKPEKVISGMALGWDTALAIAAIRRSIRVSAYIPFEGQEMRWPDESKRRYHKILRKCASTVIACPHGYSPEAMQRRNRLMVDDADMVLALWDGSDGGTANCVRYAEKKMKHVENLWGGWEFEI